MVLEEKPDKSKKKKKKVKKDISDDTDDLFLSELLKEGTQNPKIKAIKDTYYLYKDARDRGDKGLVKLLGTAMIELVQDLKHGGSGTGSKSDDKFEKMVNKMFLKKLEEDPIATTVALMTKLERFGGKSDVEVIGDTIKESFKDGTQTIKEVFGRRSLKKKIEDPETANEFSKCGQCNQIIQHPNPISCPHCGATAESSDDDDEDDDIDDETRMEITGETEEDLSDCFADWQKGDSECMKCIEKDECQEATEGAEKPKKKDSKGKSPSIDAPFSESAEKVLDDLHRVCEWVVDGVEAQQNTTTLYNLGVGNKVRKNKQPKQKDLDAFRWSLFSSEIGIPKLIELAKQWENHPEAQDYEIPYMIKVLKTAEAKGFLNASWETLKMLANKDGVPLTDDDRIKMIDNLNKYSLVKLNKKDYIKKVKSEKKKGKKGKKDKKRGKGKKSKAKDQDEKTKPKKRGVGRPKTNITDCPGCGKKIDVKKMEEHLEKDCPKLPHKPDEDTKADDDGTEDN